MEINERVETIASECTVFLDKPPCCLEFSPTHQQYFVVGTYNLLSSEEIESSNKSGSGDEDATASKSQRNGSLVVFKLARNDIIKTSAAEVPYGVLDIHFHGNTLGVATSVGSFEVFDFSVHDLHASPQLTQVTTFQISSPSVVVTSFAWDPSSDGRRVCATLTTGDVFLVNLPADLATTQVTPKKTEDDEEVENTKNLSVQVLHTHSLEAWIAAFTPDGQTIYTGGDDATLSCITTVPAYTSASSSSDPTSAPAATKWTQIWTDKRTHAAGVTALLPLPANIYSSKSDPRLPSRSQPQSQSQPTMPTDILLTGSYDDTLRVLRPPLTNAGRRRPTVLHEARMAGGVWRLALLPFSTTGQLRHAGVDAEADVKGNEEAETTKESEAETEKKDEAEGEENATMKEKVEGQLEAKAELTVLVSCMYAGASIVRLMFSTRSATATATAEGEGDGQGRAEEQDDLQCTHEVLAHFAEHESMCYAGVVAPAEEYQETEEEEEIKDGGGGGDGAGGLTGTGARSEKGSSGARIVTCSFYDRRVCLWRW